LGHHFLTSEPVEDSTPRYVDWEACASMFVAIDILTHNDGIPYYGFEGETMETARGLLVLVVCALQFLDMKGMADQTLDPSSVEDMAESFSFNEIRKRIL